MVSRRKGALSVWWSPLELISHICPGDAVLVVAMRVPTCSSCQDWVPSVGMSMRCVEFMALLLA
ncbi:hypothetical protein CHL79_00020 [Delftia acidovorans]|nr:hypothetical protein CHL79_00020 [Delftia acidovorans]